MADVFLSADQGSIRMFLVGKIKMLEEKLSFLHGQKMELVNRQEVPEDYDEDYDFAMKVLQWRYKAKMELLEKKEEWFRTELRDYRRELMDLHHAFIPNDIPRDDGWCAPKRQRR